jgi:hypothetical protein
MVDPCRPMASTVKTSAMASAVYWASKPTTRTRRPAVGIIGAIITLIIIIFILQLIF